MYASGFLMILVTLLWTYPLDPRSSILLGGILLIPGGIDGTTQLIGERESTNVVRVLTGLLLGVGVVLFANGLYFLLLEFLYW